MKGKDNITVMVVLFDWEVEDAIPAPVGNSSLAEDLMRYKAVAG